LHAALEFVRIFAILLARDDKKINVFDENFDGLVSQIKPMQGQGKLSQMACPTILMSVPRGRENADLQKHLSAVEMSPKHPS